MAYFRLIIPKFAWRDGENENVRMAGGPIESWIEYLSTTWTQRSRCTNMLREDMRTTLRHTRYLAHNLGLRAAWTRYVPPRGCVLNYAW